MTAALGGLYSSTAVIASLSIRLRGAAAGHGAIVAGIAVASAVMFGRVLVLAAILAPRAFPSFAATIGAAGLVALGYAAWHVRHSSEDNEASSASDARNPIELLPALFFAALVAATAVATRWADQQFGDLGAGAAIVISGSFDVDAATVTLGGLPPGTLSPMSVALFWQARSWSTRCSRQQSCWPMAASNDGARQYPFSPPPPAPWQS